MKCVGRRSGEKRNAYQVLIGKHIGNRKLGRQA
jgi:hypothetical protein